MKKDLKKRLLAALMAVVMVMSLITVAPAKEAQAETEVLSIKLDTLDLGELATTKAGKTVGEDFTVKDLATIFTEEASFTTLNGAFEEPEVTVSDSTCVLDDDDIIDFASDYAVSMKFTESEAGAASKVKSIRLFYDVKKSDGTTKTTSKGISKKNGKNYFSFTLKFKAATGTIKPECLTKVGSGMDYIANGIKKSARVTLADDSCVKSSVKWYEFVEEASNPGDVIHISDDKTKATLVSGKYKTPKEFTYEKRYILEVSLVAANGFRFDNLSDEDVVDTYARAMRDGLQMDSEGEYLYTGLYTVDANDNDELTLYFITTPILKTTKIYEMPAVSLFTYIGLAKDGTISTKKIIEAMGIKDTMSFKDEHGKTVTLDVNWVLTVPDESGDEPGNKLKYNNAAGEAVVSTNNIFKHKSQKYYAAETTDIVVSAKFYSKNDKVDFADYDFRTIAIGKQNGERPENLSFRVQLVKAGEKVYKKLPEVKVTFKDSAKKIKCTCTHGTQIRAMYFGFDENGRNQTEVEYDFSNGKYSEEMGENYREGLWEFAAANDGSNPKLGDYAEISPFTLMYHKPVGVDQTIKDGDVDFTVEGNPVAGYRLFDSNVEAVTNLSADSNESGNDAGLYTEFTPNRVHNCYTGESEICAPGTTYSVNMYYFLGRAEDNLGDVIPSGWKAYLNGEEVSYQTGHVPESSKDLYDGYYGNYILVTKTFEKTKTEIASGQNAGGKAEKKLFVNAPAPVAGQDVATANITVSESTAKYVTVGETKWMDEDGNVLPADGQIEDNKSYTATVTLTAKDDYVFGENLDETTAIGDNEEKGAKFIDSVEVDVDANTVTLTYAYEADAVGYDRVTGANNTTIMLPAGATREDIMNALSDLKTTITFANGGTAETEAMADANMGTFETQWDKLGYVNTYDEETGKTQVLKFYGAVDLTPYETDEITYEKEAKFVITLKVGNTSTLTIDINGGTINIPTTYEVDQDAALDSVVKYDSKSVYWEGYLFEGFFSEKEGGTRVYLANTTIDKDTTIYAHWTKLFTGVVKNVKLESSAARKLNVSWDKPVTDVSGYELQLQKPSGAIETITVRKSKTEYGFTRLDSKKTYAVRIRAYRLDSTGAKIYGAWSKAKSIVVK